MRVIAGSARSLSLKTLPTMDTRPTTDRIKETLFNMISFSVPGCRFLDLFAGSGAIGIEALSRGAKKAIFIENNRAAVQIIQENLAFTKLNTLGEVLETDVLNGIKKLDLNHEEPFDFIFMDPPYALEIEKTVLEQLRNASFVGKDTQIIIEAPIERDFHFAEEMGYGILKEKKYKSNQHVFLYRISED